MALEPLTSNEYFDSMYIRAQHHIAASKRFQAIQRADIARGLDFCIIDIMQAACAHAALQGASVYTEGDS